MPLEIKELYIKATISENGGQQSSASSPDHGESKDTIVKACVEKVMEILKEKAER